MEISDLRIRDVPADLVLLVEESGGQVGDVTYEVTAHGEDLEVIATVAGQSRTFQLTVREVS